MNRRALLLPVLAFIAACQGGETTQPAGASFSPPSFMISDGANSAGNPDFFFLPPMVPNPVGSPQYEANAFNASLKPTVWICALDPADIPFDASTTCKDGGYLASSTLAGPTDAQYHHNWKVPSSTDVYYRIAVYVGSTPADDPAATPLGFADILTAANSSGLKNVNTGLYVPMQDGRSLPIKFRIEQYALCPGTRTCSSETINLVNGGDVTANIPGTTGNSGVEIPPQGTGETSTITVQPCNANPALNSLNPSVTDLPVFGPCMRITADPPLEPGALANKATVFICDISPFTGGLSDEQKERITLHRFDEAGFAALPHAHGCEQQVGFSGSVKGFFGSLAKGQLRSAGKQLVAMVAPRPLYAAMMLDVGAGGLTEDFSDFQFALPSRLRIVAGDNQVAPPGATLASDPTVIVEDLGGQPVVGARVRFGANLAACLAAVGDSSSPGPLPPVGTVSTSWTLPLDAGGHTMVACGRGLAGTNANGPRDEPFLGGVDPFQPIQDHFDQGNPPEPLLGPVAEPVETGFVTFTATAVNEPVDFGSVPYANYGGSEPEDWPLPTGAGTPASGAFGFAYPSCTLTPTAPPNPFGVGENLFVTKTISAPYAGTLTITVVVDNDARVYLNGTEITSEGVGGSVGGYESKYIAPWFVHDGCADGDPFGAPPPVFTKVVAAGQHTISVQGRDRGGAAYLDVRIVLNP